MKAPGRPLAAITPGVALSAFAFAALGLLLEVLVCESSSAAKDGPPANTPGKRSQLPTCDAPPPTDVAKLESYVDLTVPSRYWVEMVWQDGEWWPAEHIPMPHHHATRIDLTNVAAFIPPRHRTGRVRLVVEIASRSIRKLPSRNEWRVTYSAKVLGACALAPVGSLSP
jgi:hypothetical protein